ncbi:hypothetical protein JDV02_009777 [Purpureocillium takamizusanense]|uniref:Uncharacterized protein n=1 Tax=Purpureocillium takamizusanense TaxID=2060973 RepID=A0A9Q8QMP2_9HYPO|nr:uncharacterized protein JDV02_009777 [Purpureocillium takamizusanense]UNI23994.1 hypothetical protein JDV02_009777 [Purpureocillium takamizusanense]
MAPTRHPYPSLLSARDAWVFARHRRPPPQLARRAGPAGDDIVWDPLVAQRLANVVSVVWRKYTDKTLDLCFIYIRDEYERNEVQSTLRARFHCPDLTIYPMSSINSNEQLLLEDLHHEGGCAPGTCRANFDIISIPFDWACKGQEILKYVDRTMHKEIHWMPWSEPEDDDGRERCISLEEADIINYCPTKY